MVSTSKANTLLFFILGYDIKKKLLSLVPFFTWITNYPVKKWLSGDISSGLTVGIVNLPQGIKTEYFKDL